MRRLSNLTLRLTIIALLLVLHGFTRLPSLSDDESATLAESFAFSRQALPELEGAPRASGRAVHPSLDRIAAWVSSVGAAVALADLDGDDLANDVCLVDPRSDAVVVAPVPGATERYRPFAADFAPLELDDSMAPMGCVPGDFNEDGATDLLVYFWGRPPLVLLQRTGPPYGLTAGSFKTTEIVRSDERWFTNAATSADVDGDGHVDLIFGNYFPDGARVLGPRLSPSDERRDEMQDSMSRAYNGGANRILLWAGAAAGAEPEVRFTEARDVFSEPVARGWTLATAAADLDGDLLPEIYFANDFGPDRLLHNRSVPGRVELAPLEGERSWTTPASKVLGRDSFKGMGVEVADLDRDGLLDIYVSNIAAQFALEESHFLFLGTPEPASYARGVAPFVDRSEQLGLSRGGWAWEARLADFDNDGWLEAIQATGFVRGTVSRWPELHQLAMANDILVADPRFWPRVRAGDDIGGRSPNSFFVRSGSGRFYDLSAELGLDAPHVTRGIATADVDGDGDLDFALANQWETSYLYLNETPSPSRSLVLQLLLPATHAAGGETGRRAGVPAVGARATFRSPDGHTFTAQVDGGNGHSGVRSKEIHFGLGPGSPDEIVPVRIEWRNRDGSLEQTQRFLRPGRHRIVLGRGTTERS